MYYILYTLLYFTQKIYRYLLFKLDTILKMPLNIIKIAFKH